MVALGDLEIQSTGALNKGDISTGLPVFLGVPNESKTIPIHYHGTAKIDEDYKGPNKRIKVERENHVSLYDISVNPKAATIL